MKSNEKVEHILFGMSYLSSWLLKRKRVPTDQLEPGGQVKGRESWKCHVEDDDGFGSTVGGDGGVDGDEDVAGGDRPKKKTTGVAVDDGCVEDDPQKRPTDVVDVVEEDDLPTDVAVGDGTRSEEKWRLREPPH